MKLGDSNTRAGKKLGNYTKRMGAVVVVVALAVTCFASVTGEKMREAGEYGRMIAVASVLGDADVKTEFAKVEYDEIDGVKHDLDKKQEIVTADKKDSELLAAQMQADKDKIALQNILAADSAAKDYAKKQSEKYQVNVIADIPTEVTTEVTTRMAVSNVPEGGDSYNNTAEPIYVSVDGVASGTYLGQFVATAYCPCVACCGKTNGITACGAKAQANHTIATDSRFAFGTQLVIDGQVYTVEDRGGAIEGNRIDIFFNTHEEALQYGRRTVDVYAIN